MSFSSWLQRIFSPPSTSVSDAELDDGIPGFEWNQNARIVLAIIIVFISALIIYWILS